MYLRSGRHELTAEESLGWVRSRLVPPDRQNIQQVLQANGLREYSEIDLLERSRGYSCNDDLEVYEVDAALCQGLDCDEIIDHCQRVSSGGEVRYMVMQTERERTEQRKMVRGKSTGKASGKTPEHGEIRYAVVSLPLEGAALSIGQQIRQARKHAGLTQQELAANAGIRQSVLSGLENGTGNPTLGLLEDVAAGLGKVLKVALEDPDGPEGGQP